MSRYILVFAWLALMAAVAKKAHVTKTELVNGEKTIRYRWLFAIIAFFPIILMATFRPWNFTDTMAYRLTFQRMPESFSQLTSYLGSVKKDVGFYFTASVLKIIVTHDPRVYFFILAAFQGLAVVYLYRNYSSSFFLSLFLFVGSADYVLWMFNGVRQFMAVTIALYATPFILKKRYIPAAAIILLASTFHRSALLMLPMIFIVQGDVWNKKTLLFILAIIAAILFLDQFTSFLDDSLAETQYANVISDTETFGYKGTSFLRVAVYSVPAVLSFFFRKRINEEGTAIIKVSANMSVISAGLYIFSMFTSGIFMGRLPIYCSLYGYILLPWIIGNCFKKKDKFLICSVMVLLYLAYYYTEVSLHYGLF